MSLAELRFYYRYPLLYKWRKLGFSPQLYQRLTGRFFQQLGIRTIIDIGANTGQSVVTFRLAFPEAVIYAIEPLPACFQQLAQHAAKLGAVQLYNVAVGEKAGRVTMEENEYSPSSSVLPMTDEHIESFPFTKNRRSVTVNIDTLDNLLNGERITRPLLIKMDVQGYEKSVIAGGRDVIAQADVLIVETSFETLYEGQPLFNDLYALIRSLGFDYAGALDQLISPTSGKILQQDALFIRS